jgi:site-specific recombinase XerD
MESRTSLTLIQIKDLVDEFLHSRDFKPNSQRAYRTDLRHFAEFYAADGMPPIEEITRKKLEVWLKNYAPRASNRKGVNTRKFLLWLKEDKNLQVNGELNLPWQFTDPIPKKPDRPAELTNEEEDLLINSSLLSQSKRAIMALLLDTAALMEELCELKWSSVSLNRTGSVLIGPYGNERVVPLSKNTVKILQKIQSSRMGEDDGYIFLQEKNDKPLTAAYMAMLVRRITFKVLGRVISPTEIQEFAKLKIAKNNGIESALEMLGKKRAFSVYRVDELNVDLDRLRRIHQIAFS